MVWLEGCNLHINQPMAKLSVPPPSPLVELWCSGQGCSPWGSQPVIGCGDAPHSQRQLLMAAYSYYPWASTSPTLTIICRPDKPPSPWGFHKPLQALHPTFSLPPPGLFALCPGLPYRAYVPYTGPSGRDPLHTCHGEALNPTPPRHVALHSLLTKWAVFLT